jgi:hypothetical protein
MQSGGRVAHMRYCFAAVHIPLPLNAGQLPLAGVENVKVPDALVEESNLPAIVGMFAVPLVIVNVVPVTGTADGKFEHEVVPSGQLAVTVQPPPDPMISPPTPVMAFEATTKNILQGGPRHD